jgi:hypothetical protein
MSSDLFNEFMKLLCGGVEHEQETNGLRDVVADDAVLLSVSNNRVDRGADTMKPERHGITRAPDSPNVLVVDFEHFRFIRDVRASLYGDRRSPLASIELVKP